jgi:hypothetical protein
VTPLRALRATSLAAITQKGGFRLGFNVPHVLDWPHENSVVGKPPNFATIAGAYSVNPVTDAL